MCCVIADVAMHLPMMKYANDVLHPGETHLCFASLKCLPIST